MRSLSFEEHLHIKLTDDSRMEVKHSYKNSSFLREDRSSSMQSMVDSLDEDHFTKP